MKSMLAKKELADLRSIGPAAIRDFRILGITRVDQLKGKNPTTLYNDLCKATSQRHDPCVIDVFRCAIEQAKNPKLDIEKCNWWYWTKFRKKQIE